MSLKSGRPPLEGAIVHRLALKPAAITRVLGSIAVLIVLAHITSQLVCAYTGDYRSVGFVRLFNLDVEANIPSIFSVVLLFGAAGLLALITKLERRMGAPGTPYWVLLSAGFFLMAIDEACSLHERLIRPIQAMLGGRNLGVFYFAWVIPATVLVSGLGLLFIGFLRRLPVQTRQAFSRTGIIYLTGALGVELVAGRHAELHGYNNVPYALLVVAEEGMEMTGVILFLKALLTYLRDNYGEVNFRFGTRPGF